MAPATMSVVAVADEKFLTMVDGLAEVECELAMAGPANARVVSNIAATATERRAKRNTMTPGERRYEPFVRIMRHLMATSIRASG